MSLFPTAPRTRRGGAFARMLRDQVVRRLECLRAGALVFAEHGGVTACGDPRGPLGSVAIEVRDPEFWRAIALRGALGAGEAYVAGHWWSADPVRIVRILVRDASVLGALEGPAARLFGLTQRAWHALRPNTRPGARANIRAHYDLGDDFFAEFLDPSLTYSAALFAAADAGLEDAQANKLRRLLARCGVKAGERMLEIGTGWGSMAMCAAREFGAQVTTTTISARQLELARARVAAAGLADAVHVLGVDYRDLRGEFDRIVSVEMVEAIGHRNLPDYFHRCHALLRPGGTFGMQAITIADQDYDAALRHVDFIKRHVFPGSFIPSVRVLVDAATRQGLRLVEFADFGRHYAETLRRWRASLLAHAPAIRAKGYPEALVRTWDWYFAYCEGGFAEKKLGVGQFVFERPGAAGAPESQASPPVCGDPYGC